MSVRGKVEVPFLEYDDYFVESSARPDEIVPYLERKIKDAKEKSNDKQDWLKQLEREMEHLTKGHHPELRYYRSQQVDFYYKVTIDGDVLYKEKESEEWDVYDG